MALLRVEVPKCARPADIRVEVGWFPSDDIGVPPWAGFDERERDSHGQHRREGSHEKALCFVQCVLGHGSTRMTAVCVSFVFVLSQPGIPNNTFPVRISVFP